MSLIDVVIVIAIIIAIASIPLIIQQIVFRKEDKEWRRKASLMFDMAEQGIDVTEYMPLITGKYPPTK